VLLGGDFVVAMVQRDLRLEEMPHRDGVWRHLGRSLLCGSHLGSPWEMFDGRRFAYRGAPTEKDAAPGDQRRSPLTVQCVQLHHDDAPSTIMPVLLLGGAPGSNKQPSGLCSPIALGAWSAAPNDQSSR